MERFPTLTTCPCCEHDSDRVSLSAAGFTECPSCEYVHKLTPETLEELARVALLNLPGARALALLAEARDVLALASPVAARVEPVGAMGEARGIAPAETEATLCDECGAELTPDEADDSKPYLVPLCADCLRIERAALRSRGER